MMPQTDEFGQHEVLHTASIICDMWSDYIFSHGATQADPELREAADKIMDQIAAFYQLCGKKFL